MAVIQLFWYCHDHRTARRITWKLTYSFLSFSSFSSLVVDAGPPFFQPELVECESDESEERQEFPVAFKRFQMALASSNPIIHRFNSTSSNHSVRRSVPFRLGLSLPPSLKYRFKVSIHLRWDANRLHSWHFQQWNVIRPQRTISLDFIATISVVNGLGPS